jgi:hypothetical protein
MEKEQTEKTEEQKEGASEKEYRYHKIPKSLKIILGFLFLFIIIVTFFFLGRISTKRVPGLLSNRGYVIQRQGMNRGMMGNGFMGRGIYRSSISGKITNIDGNNLTIKTDDKEYTVIISADTSIRKNGDIAKQSDLAVDQEVNVFGPSNSSGGINAQLIQIK